MPLGVNAENRNCSVRSTGSSMNAIANLALRQNRFLFLELRRGVVAAFDIGAAEPGEFDCLTARRHHGVLATRSLRRDLDRCPEDARVNHLRRHRPLPDQLVDTLLVDVENAFELARREIEIRRPDGLVRFLRVLHPRLIAARTVVILTTEHAADDARRLLQRLVRKRGGVGTVIGDQTALTVHRIDSLKQPLRHLHRPLGGEAELAAGFLRQRGRRERRCGALDTRLLFNGCHRPRDVRANCVDQRLRGLLVEESGALVLQFAG